MKTRYPLLLAVLGAAAVFSFALRRGAPPAQGGFRDAVNEDGAGAFDTRTPDPARLDAAVPPASPAETEPSEKSPAELGELAKSEGVAPEEDLLTLYMSSWLAARAAGNDAAGPAGAEMLPLLQYKKAPVQYSAAPEKDSTKVTFWTGADAGVPPTKGVLRLYQPEGPGAGTRPLILFLPPSRDPRFLVCRQFCEHFLEQGLRCAYLEKQMGDPDMGSARQDAGLDQKQAPPTSVETARRGLDALESMGVIGPDEKIGVGGVSMGAIEAALIALTDRRVGAAAVILGGGNLAKMLVSINGAGVNSYVELRERLMRERGWTRENLERELTPYTVRWDPVAYIKAVPEEQRLPSDRFMMINVIGDQAISNERSDDLYKALTGSSGRRPDYQRIKVRVPSSYKHVGVVLRLSSVKKRVTGHFQRYLPARPAQEK